MTEKFDKRTQVALETVMYNILFTNDLLMGWLFDTLTELERSPLYRHAVKKWAAVLRREMKEYNAKLGKGVGRRYIGFIADANDEFSAVVQPDLDRLFYTVSNIIARHKVAHHRLLARMSVAVTLAGGACHNVDLCTSHNPELDPWAHRFHWLRPTRVAASVTKLLHVVEDAADHGARLWHDDLSSSNDVLNGFKVLVNKLMDPETIWQVVERAEA